ncbi:hypothetical protein Tco_1371634 [Tanacetum coccineum]
MAQPFIVQHIHKPKFKGAPAATIQLEKIVRGSTSKKQVVETQRAEESVAIAYSTTSLEASGSAEELKNQPKPADANLRGIASNHTQIFLGESGDDTLRFITPDVDPENSRLCKDPHPAHESEDPMSACTSLSLWGHRTTIKREHEQIVEDVDDTLAMDFGIQSLGNVTLKDLYQDQNVNMDVEESPFDTESEIKFTRKVGMLVTKAKKNLKDHEMDDVVEITLTGSSKVDQELEQDDSDLESMPEDEISSVLGNDDNDDDDDDDDANDNDSDKPSG